jgi:hypothetical protein
LKEDVSGWDMRSNGRTEVDGNLFESKREGRKEVGRPRLGWLKDAENDL